MICHHAKRSRRSWRCSTGEDGLALLEMAMIATFLFGLVAATFDFGMAWRNGSAVTEAARTGARVGSGQASRPGADYDLLGGIRGSLKGAGLMDGLELVVIYKSTSPDGRIPDTCKRPPFGGVCNVLTGDELENMSPSNFNYNPEADPVTGNGCMVSGATYWNWCATSRNASQEGDYLGVYVRYRYDFMIQFFQDHQIIERTAVMRLEPRPS